MVDKEYIYEMARQRRMLSLLQKKGGIRRMGVGSTHDPAFYVRPAGSVYGTGDGSSYENAWAGNAGVVWASIPDGGKLRGAGNWVETFTVGKSNVTIESLIADPWTIDGNDTLTECLIIEDKTDVTIDGLTLIDATTSCSDVRDSTGIVFMNCTASGSGNQAYQHQGASVATYYDCIGSDSADDGLSLHETSIVTAYRCTFSGNGQGVNGIATTIFTGYDCIFSSNTTGIHRSFFLNNVTNNSVGNSSVSVKINNCYANAALFTITSAGRQIITECKLEGTATVRSTNSAAGSTTVNRSYFKCTVTSMTETQTAGAIVANYCVFYLTAGTAIYAMRPNASGTFTANNCTIVGFGNTGRGVNAAGAGAVTLNNCILVDLQNGYVSTGATNVVTTNNNCVFDVTTVATVVSSGTITRNGEITTDPQIANAPGDDFTTGANTKNVGASTGITTGILSAVWGDSDTAPVVVTTEQSGTYDIGAYISAAA
jgi:hypothetical protein